MKQPGQTKQVVIAVDRRAMRWLGLLVIVGIVAGLGAWIGRSLGRVGVSAFDPYATSASPVSQASLPSGGAASAPQAAAQVPVLLPPPRPDFKVEPETFAVKGDPQAPVTIVEYSDYQ